MTNNGFFIHIESGDIFYQRFNTNENFYNFLIAQQDKTKAAIPKRVTYSHIFEKYTQSFLPAFFIDDIEKFDPLIHKNSKNLFYRFNDFIRHRVEKIFFRHTAKVLDSFGMKKNEEKDRKFSIEKIIHSVEFSNPYENSIEKNPEIWGTIESNYRIIRRVYQHLYTDVADIFYEYIHSLNADEIFELDEDLKSNGWGAINLLKIENSLELLSIFQLF